jgi:hypothetical protein
MILHIQKAVASRKESTTREKLDCDFRALKNHYGLELLAFFAVDLASSKRESMKLFLNFRASQFRLTDGTSLTVYRVQHPLLPVGHFCHLPFCTI